MRMPTFFLNRSSTTPWWLLLTQVTMVRPDYAIMTAWVSLLLSKEECRQRQYELGLEAINCLKASGFQHFELLVEIKTGPSLN